MAQNEAAHQLDQRPRLRAAGDARQEARDPARARRELEADGPTTWVFNLREGREVARRLGFTADDVVFSIDTHAGADLAIPRVPNDVGTAKKIDAYTVEFTPAEWRTR
jgi:ABC-type transport system substrate-binding protein